MKKIRKFKKGAASFYIVAISTLILVIIAASFAAVIISEIARTSNDDLAQSAYDAALAGVEDAKLAYYNYQTCLENDSCGDMQGLIDAANDGDDSNDKCDMVAVMLGRTVESDKGVLVQETDTGNNMQQYYTCTILRTKVPDYKTMLTSANPTKVMRAKFEGDGVADTIKSIKVSWQRDSDDSTMKYSDFTKEGIFGTDAPLPPVLSVGLIQTGGNSFNLSDFDMTQVENEEQKTDRGTVYLVPTDKSDLEEKDNYWVVKDKYISKDGFLKSNDKTVKNKPYAVYCDNSEEYACSVTIELPDPIGGNRSDETFMIALGLPYAEASASTNVKLEFCNDEEGCYVRGTEEVDGETKQTTTRVPLKTQISIDSTGRANDLYRRVETRLEPGDTAFPYPLYAIQVLGNDSGSLINKNISPTCEWDFGNATGPRELCDNT